MKYWKDCTPVSSSCLRLTFTSDAEDGRPQPVPLTITASEYQHGFWTVTCRGIAEGLRFRADGVEQAKRRALEEMSRHVDSLHEAVAETVRQAREAA